MKKIYPIIFVVLLLVSCMMAAGCTEKRYEKAEELFNQGEYSEALEIYTTISSHDGVFKRIYECNGALRYEQAVKLMEEGYFSEALEVLKVYPYYNENPEKIIECVNELSYSEAVIEYENGNYYRAMIMFNKLKDFKDSEVMALKCENSMPFNLVEHEEIYPQQMIFAYGAAVLSISYDAHGESGRGLWINTQQAGETAVMIRGIAKGDYSKDAELYNTLIQSVLIIGEEQYSLGAMIDYGTEEYYFEFLFAVPDDQTDALMSIRYTDEKGDEITVRVNRGFAMTSSNYYESIIIPYYDNND